MIRVFVGVAALVFGMAASPATTFIVARTTAADALARIETPKQSDDTSKFVAAPLPNTDVNAPAAAASSQPALTPSLFGPKSVYHGEGFVSGSTSQTAQEAKLKPGVGGVLSVPLQ